MENVLPGGMKCHDQQLGHAIVQTLLKDFAVLSTTLILLHHLSRSVHRGLGYIGYPSWVPDITTQPASPPFPLLSMIGVLTFNIDYILHIRKVYTNN